MRRDTARVRRRHDSSYWENLFKTFQAFKVPRQCPLVPLEKEDEDNNNE
jgi:hypothetical protein